MQKKNFKKAKRIDDLVRKGLNYNSIGKMLGLSKMRVSAIVKSYGLTTYKQAQVILIKKYR